MSTDLSRITQGYVDGRYTTTTSTDPAFKNYKDREDGVAGFRIVENGTSLDNSEHYYKLYVAIGNADITATSLYGGDDLDGSVDFPAGTEIRGLFNGETLAVTTGTVIAYIRPDVSNS